MPQRPLVLCVGDSHTRGVLGADWVAALRRRCIGCQCLSFGRDGEPTERIAARLRGVLTAHPGAAAVVLLAGTNDCIEQQGGLVRAVYRLRFRTAPCSTQRAVQHVGQMLDSIATLAPGAHAVVVTLPPITEQRQHPAFVRAAELSAALRNLLVARCQMPPAAALADFHAACIARLDIAVPNHMQQQKQQGQPSNDADVATAPLQGEPLALPMIVLVKLRTLLERWLRRSWDTISASRGLLLLTDNIHINDATAELLADLVAAALPASIREAHANSQHDK